MKTKSAHVALVFLSLLLVSSGTTIHNKRQRLRNLVSDQEIAVDVQVEFPLSTDGPPSKGKKNSGKKSKKSASGETDASTDSLFGKGKGGGKSGGKGGGKGGGEQKDAPDEENDDDSNTDDENENISSKKSKKDGKKSKKDSKAPSSLKSSKKSKKYSKKSKKHKDSNDKTPDEDLDVPFPSQSPSVMPSSLLPTKTPGLETVGPTNDEGVDPSKGPVASPTDIDGPTGTPSTAAPTVTRAPAGSRTGFPTRAPNTSGTGFPTRAPNTSGTGFPTRAPNTSGSAFPTRAPNNSGGALPTTEPDITRTAAPTRAPALMPTVPPTVTQTSPPREVTSSPTGSPTTGASSQLPSGNPSGLPSITPSAAPTGVTSESVQPSLAPSGATSGQRTAAPTGTLSSEIPSAVPTVDSSLGNETATPTSDSTDSDAPSAVPSAEVSSENRTPAPTSDSTPAPTSNSTDSDAPSAVPSIGSSPDASDAPSPVPSSDAALNQTGTAAPTAGGTVSNMVDGAFETSLNLDQVPEKYRQVFIDAAAKWDKVIVGDLEDYVIREAELATPGLRCDPASIPDVVDDVLICASLPEIDGRGGILGSAAPTFARFGDFVQTSVGYMQFDLADVEVLERNGELAGTILHEMAHVYGIGTLWSENRLTEDSDSCPYKYDSRASEEYRALSGCDGPVPVETDGEKGTKCLHWDEDCFQSELMTGVNTGGLELSRISIASLEDLGYLVDYSQATPFSADLLSPSCVCNAASLKDPVTRLQRSSESEASKAARQNALNYGHAQLKSARSTAMANTTDSDRIYLGDKMIVVLYLVEDQIKSVMVTAS